MGGGVLNIKSKWSKLIKNDDDKTLKLLLRLWMDHEIKKIVLPYLKVWKEMNGRYSTERKYKVLITMR